MYPHELDHACRSILETVGVDKNVLSEVKYNELKQYVEALAALHYSKGHDDGFAMHAGYTVK